MNGAVQKQLLAVIEPDSAAEDTGAAKVEVDAVVDILDVDNTGVEVVEQMEKTK